VEGGSLRLLHQALLGEAMMTAGSAAFVTDDAGRYLAANEAALGLLGYTREELAALNVRDVADRTEEEVAEVYAMLKREYAIQRTARLRRKDGSVGEIAYVAVESTIGGLPVIVTVTAPVDTLRSI
jgi:PAS domain S-box-containing protein